MALQTTSGLPALETACIPECKISFFASTEIYSNLHRQSNDGAESTQTKKQFLNEMANLFEKKTLRNFSWRSGSFHPLGKTTLCLCWKIVLIKSDLGEGATRTCLAQPVWWQSLQREVIFTAPGTHSQYLHVTHQTMKFLPNSNKKKKQTRKCSRPVRSTCGTSSWRNQGKTLRRPQGRGRRCVAQPLSHLLPSERSTKQHGGKWGLRATSGC